MERVTTAERERLDTICHRHYGHLAGAVEAVLATNPHLAEYPPHLPAGVVIDLPSVPPPRAPLIRLW